MLAAAVAAAGLVIYGSVVAQTPQSPARQPKSPGGGPAAPVPTVRPYSEWTPQRPPPGYVPGQGSGPVQQTGAYLPPPKGYVPQSSVPAVSPAPPTASGSAGQRPPRLTRPVMAAAEGVIPAGGTVPPPDLEVSTLRPEEGPRPPLPLPPPSVVPEVGNSPAAPVEETGPTTASSPPGVAPPLPVLPPTMPLSPAPPAPAMTDPRLLPMPNSDSVVSPGAGMSRSVSVGGPLPARVNPAVSVEAICPETVVYGNEFRYELVVRNTGSVAVAGVRVEDELPAGAKYLGSDPPAEAQADRLCWSLGTVEAGAERRIVVRLRPTEEGELHSRAVVTFAAGVEAKTVVTRPRVTVAMSGPEVCKSGEEAVFQIQVSNTGTGPAQRMLLQARLSEGLVHPQGSVIEAELANLAAGESKTIPLRVTAAKAGQQWCQIVVTTPGSPEATAKASVNIVEPLLQVAQTGPSRCLVRGEPVFEITLSNPGTAATDPVTVQTLLPEGFDYVQASDNGSFVPTQRVVVWKLPGLAPGGTKTFALKLRAIAAGDSVLRTVAVAVPDANAGVQPAGGPMAGRSPARSLEAKAETAVKAEGVAAVRFEVIDLDDPVVVGREAVYEIRVTNQGTGVCTNVQIAAALGEGTAYAGSSGPSQVRVQGQHLIFEPIPTLPVKGEAVYRVRVRGTTEGDLRFRAQLTCDQVRTPVVKEESTRFVRD